MSKKEKILEKRRKEVLRAFAKGEGITSIMERICRKYDITPNAFWYDWAKIRPDRNSHD